MFFIETIVLESKEQTCFSLSSGDGMVPYCLVKKEIMFGPPVGFFQGEDALVLMH